LVKTRVHPCLETRRRRNDRKVKIAVLDTGINLDNPDIIMHQTRILGKEDWTSSDAGIRDIVGHGTYTVSLLLTIAPASVIYVAKVFDSQNAGENTAQHVADVSTDMYTSSKF